MSRRYPHIVVGVLLATNTLAVGLYKWVDDKGVVHYSDSPPAVEQKSGTSVLNKQGVVLKRGESAAERDARQAAEAGEAQARQQRQEQIRYDRALLDRYRSVQEIEAARDKQVGALQDGLRTLESQLRMASAQLAALESEAQALRNSGKTVSAGLDSQLQEKRRQQDNAVALLKSRREEVAKIRQRAAADAARLRQLQAARPVPAPTPPR